jgi:pimeloyl-ACP methyl ester carboxylesterase
MAALYTQASRKFQSVNRLVKVSILPSVVRRVGGGKQSMSYVTSKDGTRIAFERSGTGPALILVDGALCSRAFGPSAKLAPLLSRYFTVYAYDRRGRGESGDGPHYSMQRELEDLSALIQDAGGEAALLGLSSGGALALHAAASGLPVTKVFAYEPPYVNEESEGDGSHHEVELARLVAADQRGAAVKYFMRDMVGAPAPVVAIMRLMPWIWRKLASVAHTLPYDAAVMSAFRIPRERFGSIRVPTLIANGSKTDGRLRRSTRNVANAIPGARYAELPGQTHAVSPRALEQPAVAFFNT